MNKAKYLIKGFKETIKALNLVIEDILNCFHEIWTKDSGEDENLYFKNSEKLYFKLVGDFTGYLNRLLDVYHENVREKQLKYKPHILYYRQTQEYLMYLLRYPKILHVKNHDEIKQTQYYLENKEFLIQTLYEDMANQQTELFEGEFKNKLGNLIGNQKKRYKIKEKNEIIKKRYLS